MPSLSFEGKTPRYVQSNLIRFGPKTTKHLVLIFEKAAVVTIFSSSSATAPVSHFYSILNAGFKSL